MRIDGADYVGILAVKRCPCRKKARTHAGHYKDAYGTVILAGWCKNASHEPATYPESKGYKGPWLKAYGVKVQG